jgi:hypothetical protein
MVSAAAFCVKGCEQNKQNTRAFMGFGMQHGMMDSCEAWELCVCVVVSSDAVLLRAGEGYQTAES